MLVTLVLATGLVHGQAADAELAATMRAKLDALIALFDERQAATAERSQAQMLAAVSDVIEFSAITRGVLGRHGRAMNAQQIQAFRTEFEKTIIGLLDVSLAAAGDNQIKIENIKFRDERTAQVLGVVVTTAGERFELLSSVANGADGWKVRNLIVDGVNLGLTYRNQFDELMSKNGGDADAAIAAWAAQGATNRG